MNKAQLIGRVGKDPEVRSTQNDKKVANFSIATSKKFKDEEVTTWHNIVVWGKLADVIEKYVTKGDLIYLEGEMVNRSYEKDGVTKYISEVVCFNMEMLGGKKEASPEKELQPETEDLPF